MSGICGILRTDGGPVAQQDIERVLALLAHRGLDRRKAWTGGSVGLGHLLTRATPEDLLDAQPLSDGPSGLVVAADIRLDNRAELAAALGIGPVTDLPDSALLLRAYERWGEDCASHLLGDFAFALWDGRARKLVLGRDPMGQRFVYYHQAPGFFAFASEVKGLWALDGVPRELSELRIGARMLPGSRREPGCTYYEGIFAVPSGTVLTVSAQGRVQKSAYWEPHADPAHEGRSEAYYIEAYRSVLGEAVACRLRSIKPVGLLFSGGYDSAAIAALAGPVLRPQGRKLIAASSTMPADYKGTIRHARRWVELCARDMPHLDVQHVTREGRSVLTGLDQAYLSMDGPVGTAHFVITEMLERIAATGARVVMDGHGGDYTLHPRGQAALAYFLRTGQWRRFAAEFGPHLRMSGHSLWTTLKSDLARRLLPERAVWTVAKIFGKHKRSWRDMAIAPQLAQRIIQAGIADEESQTRDPWGTTGMKAPILQALSRVRARPDCPNGILAAAHGLQITRPFEDRRVVELALAIPEELYVKNGRNRYLACRALKDLYPREYQTRWRRNDDEIPDFQRMTKRIEPQLLAEIERLENKPELAQLVDFAKVRRLLAARGPDDHNSGWEAETHSAVAGFMVARYVNWFRGDNA